MSFSAIAKELGVSVGTAHRDILELLEESREKLREKAQHHIALDLQRLDALIAAMWAKAERGGVGAVDRLIKILERRARLLGLDKADKVQISGPNGGPIEISDIRERLRDRLARLTAEGDEGQDPREPEPGGG